MERHQPPVTEMLTDNNFRAWRIEMQFHLIAESLWGVVSGDESRGRDGASSSAWTQKNAAALYAIKASCNHITRPWINDVSTAKDAWEELIKIFRRQEGQTESEESGRPTLGRAQPLLFAHYIRSEDLDYLADMGIKGSDIIIRENQYTALHVAVSAGKSKVVDYFLEQNASDLYDDPVDTKNRTALALAAYHGKLKIARKLARKYPRWLAIKDNRGNIPLLAACEGGHVDTTRFLCRKTFAYLQLLQETTGHETRQTHTEFEGETRYWLILGCLRSKMFSIALEALQRDPRKMFLHSYSAPLLTLAETPTEYRLGFWKLWLFKVIGGWSFYPSYAAKKLLLCVLSAPELEKIRKLKASHDCVLEIQRIMCHRISFLNDIDLERSGAGRAMFAAVKNGNLEFVTEIIRTNLDMMWMLDESKRDLLMCAIANRQEKIASFVHGSEEWREAVVSFDEDGSNLLHMAGKLAPDSQLSRISGAALQMQRELQWFKEVESIVPDYFKKSKNELRQTPSDVFTKEHAILLKDAENWMKQTASSYSIVGALIITIMFAAAFTVPGGNDQTEGVPIFRHNVLFKIFTIFIATSFSAASTSVMVFLGILTSRYAEQDFLLSLPRKLMVGLFSLFISMTVMMFAFSIAIILMYKGKVWTIVLTVLLIIIISIPICTFGRQHLPLLKEIYVSTYHWHVFKKKTSPESRPSLSSERVRTRSASEPPAETTSTREPPAEIASTSEPPAEIAVEITT